MHFKFISHVMKKELIYVNKRFFVQKPKKKRRRISWVALEATFSNDFKASNKPFLFSAIFCTPFIAGFICKYIWSTNLTDSYKSYLYETQFKLSAVMAITVNKM